MNISKFTPLTIAEKKFLDEHKLGNIITISSSLPSDKLHSNEIRADFIRQILLNSKEITQYGILLKGAWISGTCDFNLLNIVFPIHFFNSHFENLIKLDSARIRSLVIMNSKIMGLTAQNLQCDEDVILMNTKSDVEIYLYHAKIGGNLICDGGNFQNKEGYALDLESIEVKHSVLFRAGFIADGGVRLFNATIGGSLECTNGKFINSDANAIDCTSMEVNKNVIFNKGFEAEGEVNLTNALIKKNLICINATFNNINGIALNCESINVEYGVLLREGFESRGEVLLFNARIGATFECDRGKFNNLNGTALSCESMEVKQSVFFRGGFESHGKINLSKSRIGASLICIDARFLNRGSIVLNCHEMTVNNELRFSQIFVDGTINLIHAKTNIFNDENYFYDNNVNFILSGFKYNFIEGNTTAEYRIALLEKTPDYLQSSENFRPDPWKQMARTLREMGHNTDANKIIIELFNKQLSHQKFSLSYIFRFLYGALSGVLEISCQSDRIVYSKGKTDERGVQF